MSKNIPEGFTFAPPLFNMFFILPSYANSDQKHYTGGNILWCWEKTIDAGNEKIVLDFTVIIKRKATGFALAK